VRTRAPVRLAHHHQGLRRLAALAVSFRPPRSEQCQPRVWRGGDRSCRLNGEHTRMPPLEGLRRRPARDCTFSKHATPEHAPSGQSDVARHRRTLRLHHIRLAAATGCMAAIRPRPWRTAAAVAAVVLARGGYDRIWCGMAFARVRHHQHRRCRAPLRPTPNQCGIDAQHTRRLAWRFEPASNVDR
jgi:hypothetical protein